jgi:Zn-dependent protease with chaperone function
MKLLLSSTLLALAWFAAVNIVVSAGAWLAARWMLRRRNVGPGGLLMLRLLPAAAATFLVVLVFVPGHLRFEPADAEESFGGLLVGLALLSTALLVRSGWRALSVARASAALRHWAERALQASPQEVLEVDELAGVSLAGIFRTRILIGSTARAVLTPAELRLAIAHERAHRSSRDNLKRCAMFCAPDVFGWSERARRLEAEWRAEAECRADALAVSGDETRAVQLASALVKVAQLGRPASAARHSPVWSPFHEAQLLEARIRRLVCSAAIGPAQSRPAGRARVLAAALPLGLWLLDAPYQLHQLTELLVASLP